MIPKIVHVVWVGGKPMPEKESYCLARNREVLSSHQVILWNDDNVRSLIPDMEPIKNFFEFAAANKKWAFVSDLVKVLALVRIGGWSIDADNEFFVEPNQFRRMHWVSGFENWNGHISPITAVMGAIPQHIFSRMLLGVYSNNDPNEIVSMPNTAWISSLLLKAGAVNNNQRQYVSGLDVQLFPDFVFSGPEKNADTVSHHHFSASWK
jgi:mannosyltransferase OCH1-like enzyme